ncbi:MAG: LamG-like jellyroll fold domain-containing protein, partial [Blastocatellia bacterium]
GGGFTIDGWMRMRELSPGQVIFDTRDKNGKGLALTFSNRFTLKLTLNDGQRESVWDSDPGTYAGTLKTNVWQHFAVTVDGKARIITFLVDGVLNDGGAARQYGWGRIDPALGDVNGLSRVTLAPALYGEVKMLRVYNRALTTAEVMGNFRAGK